VEPGQFAEQVAGFADGTRGFFESFVFSFDASFALFIVPASGMVGSDISMVSVWFAIAEAYARLAGVRLR